jgi:hypothetical protein
MVTKSEFHAYLSQTCENFDALESFPHYPPQPSTHYMHPPLQGGDGKALAELLSRFCPDSAIDAQLIRAFFLSLVWGGSPGSRPAFLFSAADNDLQGGRGVGKSKLVQMGARLVNGTLSVSTTEPFDKIVSRLLSPDAVGRRVVLLDNVKSLRFSWADLEGLITSNVISGHRLYSGEGRRMNNLLYCLTLNGASLSRDMAQRTVIVKLARPAPSANWEEATGAFIEKHRWVIIGDIVAALQAAAKSLARHSRWASWEDGVLSRIQHPDTAQQIIVERQSAVDDDAAEADLVRTAIADELRRRGHHPGKDVVWIPTSALARMVEAATGEKRPVNKASTYLGTLVIPELRKSNRGTGRGWTWAGEGSVEQQAVELLPEGLANLP